MPNPWGSSSPQGVVAFLLSMSFIALLKHLCPSKAKSPPPSTITDVNTHRFCPLTLCLRSLRKLAKYA